jgi:hypothetical protein
MEVGLVSSILSCEISVFIALTLVFLRKPSKTELHQLIDRVANNIASWGASPMNRPQQIITVQVVLSVLRHLP